MFTKQCSGQCALQQAAVPATNDTCADKLDTRVADTASKHMCNEWLAKQTPGAKRRKSRPSNPRQQEDATRLAAMQVELAAAGNSQVDALAVRIEEATANVSDQPSRDGSAHPADM